MFEELLKDIEQIDLKKYIEMLLNLYEDEDAYTVEIVFDEDELIIGRSNKRYTFDSVRLKAWLTVYLNEEGKKKYDRELLDLAVSFRELSEEEKDAWCEILVQYFDCTKYNN